MRFALFKKGDEVPEWLKKIEFSKPIVGQYARFHGYGLIVLHKNVYRVLLLLGDFIQINARGADVSCVGQRDGVILYTTVFAFLQSLFWW